MTYKSEVYILKHYKTIHLGYIKCPKCRKWIRDHNTKHFCRKATKSDAKQGLSLFACDKCDFVRKSKPSLDEHIQKVHKPETLVQCLLCPKYLTNSQMKTHFEEGAHAARTNCSICGKSVIKMKYHMETTHKPDSEKRFICDQCPKGFFAKDQLGSHKMNVHLKLRPFKCRYGCDQAYNDRSNMRQHERRTHGVIGPRVKEKKSCKNI